MSRVAALLAVLAWALAGDAAEGLDRLPAVLHLHSDLSTGDFSLEQFAAMAEKQGIGALLLTENYLLRIEYGLPPFRALTRVVREERSVLDGGIDRYLARVAQLRATNPRVLIVPGVEVLPHYYWSGSPLAHSGQSPGSQLLVWMRRSASRWKGGGPSVRSTNAPTPMTQPQAGQPN